MDVAGRKNRLRPFRPAVPGPDAHAVSADAPANAIHRFDAIVIGSGIGGLGAAATLARFKGWRVLVLEQHYEIGGLTHSFRRGSASWDAGLHYVGELEATGLPRHLFDFVTGGRLEWHKMPDDFDRVTLPGVSFAVPSNFADYQDRLVELYPAEKRSISRYFRDINASNSWLAVDTMAKLAPALLRQTVRAINDLRTGNSRRTTSEYLEQSFKSPQLKALLSYCWGDYGVTPKHSSFAVHALIVHHYRNGAYYPVGGPERIARLAEQVIENAGGAILIQSEALEILTENGIAEGVRVRHAPSGDVVDYAAPIVISDIGLLATYKKLIQADAHPAILDLRKRLSKLDHGASAVQVFIELRASPETIGIHGENFWLFETIDQERVLSDSDALLNGTPIAAYISFPSLKSAGVGPHTAEIIAPVRPEAFEQWRVHGFNDRAADYLEMKVRVAAGLIELADRHIPGFRDLVSYAEVATPLTLEHYIGRAGGRMYGLAATPALLKEKAIGPNTPIKGLFIAGNDSGFLGIVGALMGGLLASARSIGFRQTGSLMRALFAAAQPQGRRHFRSQGLLNEKFNGRIIGKRMAVDGVVELTLELDRTINPLAGQYLRIEVSDLVWRDYSIARLRDRTVTFLIALDGLGQGSDSVQSSRLGDELCLRGPLGDFTFRDSGRPAVFVATGTGIAPLLPMLEQIARSDVPSPVVLFFGCRHRASSLLTELSATFLVPKGFRAIQCISADGSFNRDSEFLGRVTDALESADLGWLKSDVYVAGNPEMVADVFKLASKKGAFAIHTEHF